MSAAQCTRELPPLLPSILYTKEAPSHCVASLIHNSAVPQGGETHGMDEAPKPQQRLKTKPTAFPAHGPAVHDHAVCPPVAGQEVADVDEAPKPQQRFQTEPTAAPGSVMAMRAARAREGLVHRFISNW